MLWYNMDDNKPRLIIGCQMKVCQTQTQLINHVSTIIIGKGLKKVQRKRQDGWIYNVIFTHASLPQGIMSSKVNRGLLLGLLLLTALSLAWSLFFTGKTVSDLE